MNTNITAVVLTYNEEKRIEDVMSSLKDFDQIIIHDKSSTDQTVAIAEALGAKIMKVPYYNDTVPTAILQQIKEFMLEEQPNEWLLQLTSSDIIHHNLLSELQKSIIDNADKCDVIEVAMHRYSMGIFGKDTFYGDTEYKPILVKRSVLPTEESMVHESAYANMKKYRMKCLDSKIAIYHLTHPNLDLIMDRHWRYAVQYVDDAKKRGRNKGKILKYAVHECMRLLYRYFRQGIYRKKETGKAQLMMLIMYNCMIYLNAFFDKEKVEEIEEIYREIREECRGENE